MAQPKVATTWTGVYLNKSDKDILHQLLGSMRVNGSPLTVKEKTGYVWGFLDEEPIIGFTWVPKRGWRVYYTMMVFSHDTLDHLKYEVERIQTFMQSLERSWLEWCSTTKEQHWLEYVGAQAAIFTRAPLPETDKV